jgi:hypothetical protein
MKHGIDNMPQDIGQTQCRNQTTITMTKHMLETPKSKKSFWTKAVVNVVYKLI